MSKSLWSRSVWESFLSRVSGSRRISKRRRTSLRTNWKNGQPIESLESRVVPAAVSVSFATGTLTLVSTAGNTNEIVSVKAGAAFTDILVGGKLTTRLSGTDFDDITTIVFNADGGGGDSLSVTGITSNSLTVTLTGVEKLQLNTGDSRVGRDDQLSRLIDGPVMRQAQVAVHI